MTQGRYYTRVHLYQQIQQQAKSSPTDKSTGKTGFHILKGLLKKTKEFCDRHMWPTQPKIYYVPSIEKNLKMPNA